MNSIRFFLENKILQNILVWVVVYIISLGLINAENKLTTSAIAVIIIAIPIYVNNLLIAPRNINHRLRFLGLSLLNSILFTFIIIGVLMNYAEESFQWRMLNILGFTVLTIAIGYSVKLSRDSYFEKKQAKEAKLNLLKEQLNPHFLFNTLNNLYGISISKSEKLPDLLLKLSELLRYGLYETNDSIVPIEKEISYLENYIALEKIRLENPNKVQLKKEGNFSGKTIPPLLLIVFVENAFKHGSKAKGSSIELSLIAMENNLKFICKNDYQKELKPKLPKKNSGIGLKNVKQRLQLIYPKSHNLKITQGEKFYTVELNIAFK